MAKTAPNNTAPETDTALVLRKNPSHNVSTHIAQAKNSLAELATVYLVTEAAGHSHATLDAKRRDLQRFLSFYQDLYKHDRPEEWFVSVTKAFLKALQRDKLAQASLVRIYATVRHFARRLHRKFPGLFPLGCPTEGVKPPAEPTADWKGLTRLDEIRLTAAAQTLRARPGHGTNQGLRNHALLAVLLGSACACRKCWGWTGTSTRPRALHGCRSKAVGSGISCRCIGTRARSSMTGWRRARTRPLPSLSRAPADDSPAVKRPRSSNAWRPRQTGGCRTRKK